MTAVATWGLFVAWLLHDAEELVTMPHWARRNEDRLRRRFPRIPPKVWQRIDVSRAQTNLAIALVGAIVLAAAWAGARTGGHSAFYQIALAAFGAHALLHLGQSALVRGYTPGVLTAPVIVLPFSLWAWSVLPDHGIDATSAVLALVLIPLVVGGSHGLAHAILKVAGAARPRRPAG
jgi:hypothetical protein